MWRNKRASTLIMAICLLAFVMIIGVGVMLLAGIANMQVSRQFGRQQADYAAQSVLDTVCAQIMDGTVDPLTAPNQKMTGGGEDDVLGEYRITIEKYEENGALNTFKVSVNAERSGYRSGIYSLVKYEAGGGEIELPALFDVAVGATNKNPALQDYMSKLDYSKVKGSVFFDNGGFTTTADVGYVSKNIDVIGPLELNSVTCGTQTEDPGERTHAHATGDITANGAVVYSDIRSEANVVIGRGNTTTVEGDIYANGNVTVSMGAAVKGDIHAGGDILIEKSAKVTGDLYGNGTVTDRDKNVFTDGNVKITDGAAVTGDVYANGAVEISGRATRLDGNVYANGDVSVKTAASVTELVKSNGSVTVETQAAVNSVECIKDVVFKDGSTANGTVAANGTGTFGKATIYGAVSVAGKIDVAGTAFRNKEGARTHVASETEINITGLGAPDAANGANPDFYAPQITVDGVDASYCNFYAAGAERGAGTIIVSNTNGVMSGFYANGDIMFTDCNSRNKRDGLQGVTVKAARNLTLNNSNCTDPNDREPVSIEAGGMISIYNSYVKGEIGAGGDIVMNGNGGGQAKVFSSTIATAKRLVMNGNSYIDGPKSVSCLSLEMHGTSSMTAPGAVIAVFGTEPDMKGFLMDTTSPVTVGTMNINGPAIIENGSLSLLGELTAKEKSRFVNTSVSGTVRLGAMPAVSGSKVNYTVDAPDTLPTAPEYKGVAIETLAEAAVEPVKPAELKYDEMDLVQLKLDEKYASVPEWKIPDLALAQIGKNNITLYFDRSKDDPALLDGEEYVIRQNAALSFEPGGSTWGKKIVFDASEGDLYVKLMKPARGGAFTVPAGVSLLSKGEHNVYLFLDEGDGTNGHTNFTLGSNCFMGRYEYDNKGLPYEGGDPYTPSLFLISNAKGADINLTAYNSTYAFIYAPYGSVDMTGRVLMPYGIKYCGSAIAAHISMGSNGENYVQYTPAGPSGEAGGWIRIGTYYMPGED